MNVEYRNGTSSFIIRYSILNSFKLATLRSRGEPHLAAAFRNCSDTLNGTSPLARAKPCNKAIAIFQP